jgi:hypothetical protein
VISHLYSIKIEDDNSYTGVSSTTVIRDGRKYSSISTITGRLRIKRKDVFLTYKDHKPIREHQLPFSADWCREEGFLYLLEDADRPGQYFIKAELGCPDHEPVTRIYF